MSAQPAPAPDPAPARVENELTESQLEELHRENPLVKLFSLFGKLWRSIRSLRHWPALTRRQRLLAVSAVSGSAITVTFLVYELIANVSKLIPDPNPVVLYEVQPRDTNLEKHDVWFVSAKDAGNVATGSEEDGYPKQIAGGASVEFRPDGDRRLADFDSVFELVIRSIPQTSVWVLRQDLEEGTGYRFRLRLPAKETDTARLDAHLLESGGKETAGSCVTQGSPYGGVILPGHVLRVTIRANGNTVSHEFMLVSPDPEKSHEQADGRTVVKECRFARVAPPGFIGFHALNGQLAIRNFRLCPVAGSKAYDPGCLDRQD